MADTMAQLTNIVSVRPEVNVAKFLGKDALTLNIDAEAAFSLDDSTRFDTTSKFTSTTIMGSAIRGGEDAGYAAGDRFGVKLNVNYIMNDDKYRNELAQSPAFVPSRVMNIENDLGNVADMPHYTTFDALYHSVFKFTPQMATSRWQKAPFMKNSWTRTIFNQRELDSLGKGAGFDPAVNLVMPLGPATPNRQGISTNLKGTFLKGAIEVKGLLSMLSEKDLDTVIRTSDSAKVEVPATAFSQMGGGLKVDVSKFIPAILHYPLELSGSMVLSSAVNDGITDTLAITPPKWEISSSFINAGLYWKFFKRTALTGGLQLINVDAKIDTAKCVQDQMHWAAGLEWKVSQGADVVASYGKIGVVNDKTNPRLLRSRWAVPTAKDFTQDLVDVSLRVKF
jgi:hypothetical protein